MTPDLDTSSSEDGACVGAALNAGDSGEEVSALASAQAGGNSGQGSLACVQVGGTAGVAPGGGGEGGGSPAGAQAGGGSEEAIRQAAAQESGGGEEGIGPAGAQAGAEAGQGDEEGGGLSGASALVTGDEDEGPAFCGAQAGSYDEDRAWGDATPSSGIEGGVLAEAVAGRDGGDAADSASASAASVGGSEELEGGAVLAPGCAYTHPLGCASPLHACPDEVPFALALLLGR